MFPRPVDVFHYAPTSQATQVHQIRETACGLSERVEEGGDGNEWTKFYTIYNQLAALLIFRGNSPYGAAFDSIQSQWWGRPHSVVPSLLCEEMRKSGPAEVIIYLEALVDEHISVKNLYGRHRQHVRGA